MKKSTKGALAAAAAGSLLLGGAGSLAYWTDAETVGGGSIASGHLKLLPVGTLRDVPADRRRVGIHRDKIVPGDTLDAALHVHRRHGRQEPQGQAGRRTFRRSNRHLDDGLSHTAASPPTRVAAVTHPGTPTNS